MTKRYSGIWVIKGNQKCFKCEKPIKTGDDLTMRDAYFDGTRIGAMFHRECWERLGLNDGEAYIVEDPGI